MTRMSMVEVVGVQRLGNTKNGNPRWRVFFDNLTSAVTGTDSACAGTITQSSVGRRFTVTYRDGKIVGMVEED